MSQPTFTFNFEIHYRGSIAIDAADQSSAYAIFRSLQVENLVTNSSGPQIAVNSVESNNASTSGNGNPWEPY